MCQYGGCPAILFLANFYGFGLLSEDAILNKHPFAIFMERELYCSY